MGKLLTSLLKGWGKGSWGMEMPTQLNKLGINQKIVSTNQENKPKSLGRGTHLDADTTKPSSCWKIPSCCSLLFRQVFAQVWFTIALWSSLGFDLLRTKDSSLSLRVTKHLCDLYADVLKAHRMANSGRHKIQNTYFYTLLLSRLFAFPVARSLECAYSPHQSSTFNPLLQMSCHLHYSNFCG